MDEIYEITLKLKMKMKNLRGCLDKNDVLNTWKEVADQLDFIGNSKSFILTEI